MLSRVRESRLRFTSDLRFSNPWKILHWGPDCRLLDGAGECAGRPLSVSTDSDGGARSVRQTTQYNERGQVAWTEDGATNRTAFAYDAAGRQTAVTNALGQVTTTLYDALGNVTNVTGATYPVSYGYDAWNRMVWMKTYRDENGAGDLTQWQYDLATGLVTNKVYADGKGTAYAYTADGKLARRTWARGIATDYGYTTAGELEAVDYSDATPDVSYTHDRLGRPVTISDVLGTRTNVYDVATLALAQEKLPDGLTLTRSQDVLGRASGISVTGGGDPGQPYAVEYGYDAYGRFGSVTSSVSSVSSVVNYSYVQGSDILAGWTSNAGMSFHRTYEPHRDLIVSITNAWNGAAVSSFAYTNDELGRRTARVDSGLTQNSFGYNIRSEVIEAIMGSNTYDYEYDPIGNRLTATNNAAVTTYAANELNQYTNVITGASVAPTYDDDGNMTDDGAGLGMVWDGENRLIQTVKNGQTITYAYDHMSRRVSKTVSGTTHAYVYDGWNLIRETAGTNVTQYVWGLDLSQTLQGAGGVGGLLSVSVAGGGDPGSFAPTYDANGNISEYLNLATGAIAAHLEYDVFGRVIATTGTAPSAFGFSTKYTDEETGLVYYGYRYYSPELGRWLSRDPIGERGGVNLHAAPLNDPINLIDPDGYVPQKNGAAVTDPSRVNCAGGALGDGTYLAPAEGASWKDVATERGFGDFKQVKSSKECEDHCGACRDAVVMYVPKYHEKKDPFNDPYDPKAPAGSGYRDKNGDRVYDVHFAKRPAYYGAARPKYPWYHIPGAKDRPASISPGSYVWPLYDKNYDPLDPDDYVRRHYGVDDPSSMWCMCKDKK